MKTTKFLTLFMSMGIALLFNSCSKDGAAGPAGANGTNGINGTNGANGVANISSNIFSITPGSWSNPQTGQYIINFNDDSIKNASKDGIEFFVSTNSTLWLGLPTSNLLANGDQMEYAYQNGQMTLIYLNSSAPSSTIDLKVVVIPPAELLLHPNTNWNDYTQLSNIIQSER